MTADNAIAEGKGSDQPAKPDFFYFVDTKKYDWPQSNITGAQIRAAIPGLNPTFQIFLEGHGQDADKLVVDTDTFTLGPGAKGELHFYTAPPATFGVNWSRARSL
jgi:hypothetical protein